MKDIKNIQLGAPIEYNYLGIKRRSNIIRRHVSLKNKYFLDIGCGNGAQTIDLLRYAKGCIAIDVEKERLEVFQWQLRKRGIRNCKIRMMNAMNLYFLNKTFDTIFCIETLEHIKEQEKALNEMYRVLKDNGDLVLSVPNRWWIFETHGANLPLLSWNRVPFFSWLPKKIHDKYAYARTYTKKEIVDLVYRAGFRNIRTEFMMPPLDRLENKFLQNFFRHIIFFIRKNPIKNFWSFNIYICSKREFREPKSG
ncbi:MAG: methyltransferase domain-containing protein [Candidatus Pacebacteria bacterium]|nr:methyltransferase domain-containing protein [Candidatus Paceibacterota bacterium]